ncbi:zinc chelation protein SecC [Endozoicomonas sp. OPT23]|uniref:PBPRA1643 family SWIM/SEC-C metal-binding motif protein n=1 Tax=Endozoicomonas sp. OPT23 TaxID=2072845 RepID=UPI00129B4882|nr:PBPRA1643 family SWIM/SEC-C metal-binding motif protein [Endozoicomonas sp. OPT23]MRI33674.1 zinc chelation protein SecC [Endozoicomonas sp. OPT23]
MLYADGNRLMNLADKHSRGFDSKKTARLGTDKNPANIVVQTEERLQELDVIFKENDWKYVAEVNEEAEENLSDLELLKNLPTTKVVEKTPGRNDPCSCGSGKKFKKCCG